MKFNRTTNLCVVILGLSFNLTQVAAEPSVRSRDSFNTNWQFARFGAMPDGSELAEPEGLESPEFDDSAWRQLDTPHDWGIEGPFRQELPGETGKLPWAGIGWYRKHFTAPELKPGEQLAIDFDGAMSDSTIYLNGQEIGGWPYGYTSFRVDLTPHVKPGAENVLAVRLDNKPNSSRWYPGGGIYRNVWLVKTGPVRVAHDGVFITTPKVTAEAAQIQVDVTIDNALETDSALTVQATILPLKGVGPPVIESVETTVNGTQSGRTQLTFELANPQLCTVDKPQLYQAIISIQQNGKRVDRYSTTFGIRKIEFTADRGFLLNGERVPLNGVCLHHDLGPLGAAVSKRGIERQLEILKEMGCNAIRTSHNPPAPELLEACDRMGFLVQVEAFDCWAEKKTRNDYNRFFKDWHERDLVRMVRRDRNHSSVIMWSIGNEIREQRGAAGPKICAELAAIVRREDPTRPVTSGCNVPEAADNGYAGPLDLFGYNYKPHLYEQFTKKYPQKPVYGSETSSCISTRGEYYFPVGENQAGGQGGPFQMSSYDLYAPNWATTPDKEFAAQDRYPKVFGEFVWTGFDYLGEPTPYNDDATNVLNGQDAATRAELERQRKELKKLTIPSRSSYFGILDLCGFKKDRFYIYQARWRPELPMAHILPHWTWPDRVGQVTPVHVYTSGDVAELWLNGKSLGRRKKGPGEYRLRWNDVQYEPGELRVEAYRNGKPWATDLQRTAGPAAKIELTADRPIIAADGQDLCFLTARVLDAFGVLVPQANNHLTFKVEGAGSVIGVCNGDPTSHLPFQAAEMPAFNGLCLAIVRAEMGKTGELTVSATAEGVKSGMVKVSAK